MILFFDTETTGLPARGLPPNESAQPHMVQLAALLADDDGTERASLSLIIRPPVDIPAEAAAIHGIDNGLAAAAGVSPVAAVSMWSHLARRASLVVAHNIAFDMSVMHTAWLRTQTRDAADLWTQLVGARDMACTMLMATPVLKLPATERMRAAGMHRPKAPKLEECIRHFFAEPLTGAHDALVDVRACARVFFHLRNLEREAA